VLNYILYRIGQFIALTLPLRFGYRLAVLISDIRYLFAYKDRANVKANLKAIFPEKSEREIRKIRIRMFRNFAKYLVDFFRFSLIDQEYIRKNIHLENMHYIDEALNKKKGVIALSAHLGNWELGAALLALLGYPFYAVVKPHKYKKVNDFFNFQRESKGVKIIPLGKAVRQCLNVLKNNCMVALVGDRDFTEKGIIVDFLGRPAFLPEGAAAFSLKTGAVIVPGFMLRNIDDSFTLTMEKPIDFVPEKENQEAIRELILHYKTILEDYIRRYPDQWYMFRKFWVENHK